MGVGSASHCLAQVFDWGPGLIGVLFGVSGLVRCLVFFVVLPRVKGKVSGSKAEIRKCGIFMGVSALLLAGLAIPNQVKLAPASPLSPLARWQGTGASAAMQRCP